MAGPAVEKISGVKGNDPCLSISSSWLNRALTCTLDVFDDLLARALRYPSSYPCLDATDERQNLSQQMTLFGFVSADDDCFILRENIVPLMGAT